ncbi:hypothetical protein EVG20_g8255 [Dentipellis fragilis]|uniref:Uncharacterized protein n=1 Tax=Dentipellis fragilis TaxID=205917 RepID=A0A4Y9Y7Y1_9AGAM|nr:hypothetical protein EVG20_g8255 [Dentipellis fragilis]
MQHIRIDYGHRMNVLECLTQDLDNPMAPHLETITITNQICKEDLDEERKFIQALIDSFQKRERSPLLKKFYLQGYQPGFAREVEDMIDRLDAARFMEIMVGGNP